ncbi:unnamed protein product [Lupinus luteus]|uniref:DUF4283 domain-containing protein n=1 Tax=Lupinus luteus TaxID=3873 RepID=A0AAV1YA81_LUPLU
MFVGEIRNCEDDINVSSLLASRGLLSIQLIPMGSKTVLLKGEEGVDVKDYIKQEEIWCKNLFKEIRRWSPGELAMDRTIWVRCSGIPMQAWTVEFFKLLIGYVGQFIMVSEATKCMERLDVWFVLLATESLNWIDLNLKVKVGDIMYGGETWPKVNSGQGGDGSEDEDDDIVVLNSRAHEEQKDGQEGYSKAGEERDESDFFAHNLHSNTMREWGDRCFLWERKI